MQILSDTCGGSKRKLEVDQEPEDQPKRTKLQEAIDAPHIDDRPESRLLKDEIHILKEDNMHFVREMFDLLYFSVSFDMKNFTRVCQEFILRVYLIKLRKHLIKKKIPLELYEPRFNHGRVSFSNIQFKVKKCSDPEKFHEQFICIAILDKKAIAINISEEPHSDLRKLLVSKRRYSLPIFKRDEPLTFLLFCIKVPKEISTDKETRFHELIYKIQLDLEDKHSYQEHRTPLRDFPKPKLDVNAFIVRAMLTAPDTN